GKAELAETSVVRDAPLMVAVDAEARGASALVRVASEVTPEQLVEIAPDRLDERTTVEWNAAAERAERVARLVYDGLMIEETRAPASGPEASELLFRAAQGAGLTGSDFDALRLREAFAKVPLDDAAIERALRDCCEGRTSMAELREAGLVDLVRAS